MIPLFTFVVPACNVAPYAAKMVESIKNQTDPDFEAVIVSESSTDNTLEVLASSIGGDPRFRVVPRPRSGSASVSRNYGIEHGTGVYCVFVDGDDWIEPDSLARFRAAIEEFHSPDMILADWVLHRKSENGTGSVEKIRNHFLEPGKIYSGPESLAVRFATFFQPGSPAQIIRRDFLVKNRLFQVPGRCAQDCEWTPRVNFYAETVVYLPYCYYHYRKRSNSVTVLCQPSDVTHFTDNILSFLHFRLSREFPPCLKKPAADWFGWNFRYYFQKEYAKRYPASVRRKEFLRLVANGGLSRIAAFLREGGISQKALIIVLRTAALPGGFGAASVLYRILYGKVALKFAAFLKRGK